MMAVTGGSMFAGASRTQEVTVCMERINDMFLQNHAQAIASKMFADIGVTLTWRPGRGCPPHAIFISTTAPPVTPQPDDALAYALPYEGRRIGLFVDRIQEHGPTLAPYVLAHVMVHEITHILQGVTRHSDYGIMKATWNAKDFWNMPHGSLRFTNADVDLIYRGVAARQTHPR
jgi:hypothetical protein